MEPNMNKAGVYKLECINNGKVYIGKTMNFSRRLRDHKNSKRKDRLQNAIRKYGWDSFSVEILEIVENFNKLEDNDYLLMREAYYIERFDATNVDKGYNMCKYSTDRTGIPLSEQHKEKLRQSNFNRGKKLSEEIREKMRGRKVSEETKEKLRKPKSEEAKLNMRKAHLGKKRKPFSEEHKEKLRQASLRRLRNYSHSEETIEKIRQLHLGTSRSEETKNKMSLASLGKPKTEEHREKIRKANLGKKHSDESKAKMSKSKIGKKMSDDHKEKIRQAHLKRRISRESY